MLTPTHGFLANISSRIFSHNSRQKLDKKHHWCLLIGAMIPDAPLFLAGLREWIKYLVRHPQAFSAHWIKESFLGILFRNEQPASIYAVRTGIGYYAGALYWDQVLHTVFFWLVVLLLARYFGGKFRKCFSAISFGAIVFHILIDWPTHTFYKRPYFWPFARSGVSGFISHDNPALLWVEIAIFVFWILSVAFHLGRRSAAKP